MSPRERAWPLVEAQGRLNDFSLAQRTHYLEQYGTHSQSFTTLQPTMQYFDMDQIGYIAFACHYNVTMVLSDPVCDPRHFETLLRNFHQHYPKAVFIQISDAVINVLHDCLGYRITQMGTESRVDLDTWCIKGKSKKTIRQAINQATEMGIHIQEESTFLNSYATSQSWLETRTCKTEIAFLIRPMEMAYCKDVRYFYAYCDNKMVGFIVFDPIYHDGKIIAYIPNISRSWKEFQQGLWYAMMQVAMEKFKQEGIKFIDLGLTPLSGLGDAIHAYESKIFRMLLRLIYRYGGFIYNFKGLEFTKARYKGAVSKCYIAHHNSLPLWGLIATFRKCRII